MIDRVIFKNFKALRDNEIDLQPLTLIVGPNASGKTSILEGLLLVSRLKNERPEDILNSLACSELLTKGENTADHLAISVEGNWSGKTARDKIGLKATNAKPKLTGWIVRGVLGQGEYRNIDSVVSMNVDSMGTVRFFQLNPEIMAKPSYSSALHPVVGQDGADLSSVLSDIALSDPETFRDLQERLRSVIPSFWSIRLARRELLPNVHTGPDAPGKLGYEILFHFAMAKRIPADSASQGALITLALLTILQTSPQPSLILLDELERGLHPKALAELVTQIRGIMKITPGLQIVATTHSPYLVDCFKPEEILLTTLRDDGTVAADTLSRHPEFDRWKDEMRPGEFWSTVGEDWVKNNVEHKTVKK